jgi:Na+-transporting NADH:ubiquinone oxidoreductase subunit NqrB
MITTAKSRVWLDRASLAWIARKNGAEAPTPARETAGRAMRLDPRIYQIVVLSGLFLYGTTRLRFDVGPAQAAVTIGTALLVQWACTAIWKLPRFDPKSALISGLSLCLLLRTNHLALAAAAAAVAVSSKFLLRWRGKHVWNPTNLGITAMIAFTGQAWVSPGQWGSVAFFGFLTACAGGLVVNRAARSDVTYAFLASWIAIVMGRALWLGQPLTIPLHMLQNGALLIFAFFMISDPKTTPDTRAGRILFAVLVASGAGAVQFLLYRTNGLLWSLAVLAAAVPLIDRILPGPRYAWTQPAPAESGQGVTHETLAHGVRSLVRPVARPRAHGAARP